MAVRTSKSVIVYDASGVQGYLKVQFLEYSTEARPVFHWEIRDGEATKLEEGDDLSLGVRDKPDAHKAMGALVAMLGAAAEQYEMTMRGRPPADGPIFSEPVTEWAYGVADELGILSLEMEGHGVGL